MIRGPSILNKVSNTAAHCGAVAYNLYDVEFNIRRANHSPALAPANDSLPRLQKIPLIFSPRGCFTVPGVAGHTRPTVEAVKDLQTTVAWKVAWIEFDSTQIPIA